MGQAGRILPTMTMTFLGAHLVRTCFGAFPRPTTELAVAGILSPVQPLSWVLLVSLTTHFCHTLQSNWQMSHYCFIEQWKKTALNDYLKTFSQLMRHTLTELFFFLNLFIVFYMLIIFGWSMLRSVVTFYAVVKDYLLSIKIIFIIWPLLSTGHCELPTASSYDLHLQGAPIIFKAPVSFVECDPAPQYIC